LYAQEAEDRTLLSHEQMRSIINEASGERALHHVLELVPYPRVRPASEYETTFRETDMLVKYAKEYGFSDVEVESFPSNGPLWQPSQGELWMIEPEVRKLYDIYDIAVSLAGNTPTGDVTAEVVDVGVGARSSDYEGKDVEGKIVLGSTRASTLQRNGVFERGAVGVVSYNSIRYDDYPDQIMSTSISSSGPDDASPGFAWAISPREARELQRLLNNGQKVVLRSIVKARTFPGELETIHATIPGDGSTDQVVGVSAHVYEGYIKMGANDDNSGTGLTLEMGRAYIRLIKEGKLPPPKRTIHFLWVPEISGTNAWLEKHEDIKKNMIADLNFDMEGIRLSTSRSYWVLHRTPNTFPSFLNDVSQSFMEWVSEVNRERVRFRANGYRPSFEITSPNGSKDPFYIKIDKHYGASDHVIYMQHGIPSVMFITWPDMWYHSSQDIPQQLDPTQLRRAAVVGIAAMGVIAAADDPMAMRVAGESLTRGAERMGEAQRKGVGYMADTDDAEQIHVAYKEALNAVVHQAMVEKATVVSASVLFEDPEEGKNKLETVAATIDGTAEALQQNISAYYAMRAEQLGTNIRSISTTDEEMQASRMIINPGEAASGGWRAMWAAMGKLSPEDRAKTRVIPQHMTSELSILGRQGKSVLEIRDFLSGEFEPIPLNVLVDYFTIMEKVKLVKIGKK
jgi:Zn-dependent M28 family amino/carboxypeptidase